MSMSECEGKKKTEISVYNAIEKEMPRCLCYNAKDNESVARGKGE
jgi:hypothetical protein